MSDHAEQREEYVRGLLGDLRKAIWNLRDTEAVHRAVHAEYQEGAGDAAARVIAKQCADNDVRVTTANSHGAWYRDLAQTYALAYLVERDVDDRKARR